ARDMSRQDGSLRSAVSLSEHGSLRSVTEPRDSDLADADLLAADVAWDLDPLVGGRGDAGVDALLDDAAARADALAPYRGRIGDLDAAGLAALMHEIAVIADLLGRAGSYAHLRYAVDSADPTRGALVARVDERETAIGNEILFVELEWAALDDVQAE